MIVVLGAVAHELLATRRHPTLKLEIKERTVRERNLGARFIFTVVEYPLLITLNGDVKPSVNEFLCDRRRQSRAPLKLLRLATKPETWSRHIFFLDG